MTASLAESLGFAGSAAPAEHRELFERIDAGLRRVESTLEQALSVTDPVVDAMTKHLNAAGGKRTRPLLVLLAAELGSGVNDEVVAGAVAIEITHLASLYHDDVMDTATLRRGVPAAQEVWGNSVAILAGDLLFARAGMMGAPLGEEFAAVHARTFERMCLGQLHETIGPKDGDPVAHYIQVLADKTGALIAASAEIGALLSGADPALREPLRQYGERIGVAFQLVDDVIDLSGEEATGKQAGTDLRTGVITLPLLQLRKAADADSRELLAALEAPGDDFAEAVQRLHDHEATAQTLAEAARWRDAALDAIAPVPEGAVRSALEQFAGSIVTRTH